VAPVWRPTAPGVDAHRGWVFDPAVAGCTADPVFGAPTLRAVYEAAAPGAAVAKFTVPVLVDTVTRTIVNNESADLVAMLDSEFDAVARVGGPVLRPPALVPDIDAMNAELYDAVNNGVYKAGFATRQAPYDAAVAALFAALDALDARLSARRFLVGAGLTEADVRLFVTLVRFDAVYHTHFKCSKRLIAQYPALSGWLRDVHGHPGVAATVRMGHIREHYYRSHPHINPTGIVAVAPDDDFTAPHGREALP
jgi:glutathionyl-hydroquinone reductase